MNKVLSVLVLGAFLGSGVTFVQAACLAPHLPFGANPTSVSSTLHAAGVVGPVSGADVDVQISHTRVGDVIVTLAHGGTVLVLIDRPGVPSLGPCGCTGDNIDVNLTDTGASSVEDACSPGVPSIGGTLAPSPDALSAFDGADGNGDWTLTVSDATPESADGTFESWCIDGLGGEFTGGSSTPTTSVGGVVALIAMFLGLSLYFLRHTNVEGDEP